MADGFNIHANVRIGPMGRDALERLCRYVLRPALCSGRLELLDDGRILARLKRRWSDGTWAKVFELHANVRIGPLARDALERLCRYILRPALCNARMERIADGRIVVKLKRTWTSDFREPEHVEYPHAEVGPPRRYLSLLIYSPS